MKILVFSDSHRFLSGMVQAIEEEKPDQVIHLGDLMGDAEELSWRFQTLPICMVPRQLRRLDHRPRHQADHPPGEEHPAVPRPPVEG